MIIKRKRIKMVTNNEGEVFIFQNICIFGSRINPMRRVRVPFLLLYLIIFSSCRQSAEKDFNLVEAFLFQDKPDSAMSCLEKMDRKSFRSESNLARYALLKSIVLDKSNIASDDDSLTRKAVEFFSKRPGRNRMLSFYYHGLVLANARSYSSAIVAFEIAEEEALRLNDGHYLGLINRNKADVFSSTYDHENAVLFREKAIGYFGNANEKRYKAFAELSLAIDYMNNEDYSKADSLFTFIRNQYNDPILNHYCDIYQAEILIEYHHNPEMALTMFRRAPKEDYSVIDFGYLALAFEQIQQRDSSDLWLTKGNEMAVTESDSAALDYLKSRIVIARGRYREGFYLVDRAVSVQDSLTRVLLRQSISAAQRDYYKSESLLKEEKVKGLNQRFVFTILIAILVLSLFISLAVFNSQKKERQLKENMATLAFRDREMNQLQQDNAHLVGTLFSGMVHHLDTLCEGYYQEEDSHKKEVVYRQIKTLVTTLRKDPELFSELQRNLDRYCNQVMERLSVQVPRIRGENLHLIMLFFAGFSYETVQILMSKNSIASLKTVRSRLRKEILDANAPDADLFLKMLEMKSGRKPAQMKT